MHGPVDTAWKDLDGAARSRYHSLKRREPPKGGSLAPEGHKVK